MSRVPQEEAAIWHGKKPEREANEKLRKGLIRERGSGKHAVQDGGDKSAVEESARAKRRFACVAYFATHAGAVLAFALDGGIKTEKPTCARAVEKEG